MHCSKLFINTHTHTVECTVVSYSLIHIHILYNVLKPFVTVVVLLLCIAQCSYIVIVSYSLIHIHIL